MARKPRIDYPGAWHHVMHKSNRRAGILKNDIQCNLFYEILDNIFYEFELEIHSYCLLPDQYHLLVRSTHGNLSQSMRRLNATFTQQLNQLEGSTGHIFKGRFRSQPVLDEINLPYLLSYIHLKPVLSRHISSVRSPFNSSHRIYAKKEPAPLWLSTWYFESLFKNFDELNEYVEDLQNGKYLWPAEMQMDTGWLKQKEQQNNALPIGGSQIDQSRFMSSNQAISIICQITGVQPDSLLKVKHGPKANPARRFAVWALKDRTLLTHKEIGDILKMSQGQVAHVLRRIHAEDEPFTTWFDQW